MSRSLIAVCLLSSFASVMYASDADRKTVITITEPLIVAGVPVVTLEPGKYVLLLDESSSDRHIVRIFNERQDTLFTTVLAIPNYRLEPNEKTMFAFWETPNGNPRALRAWFYPGDNFGQEFVYPKGLAAKIASESGTTVVATPAETAAELQTLPLTEFNKSGEEKVFVEEALAETEPAPGPVAGATPEPAPERAPAPEAVAAALAAPETLPATASPFFAVGLAGLIALLAGASLRRVSRV
ncbi:MAG TPA: hypothetical protein VGG72_25210 [Bryobacteraceae bacterium]